MKFIIVHFHLRPGGIRRIIELATPYLIKEGSSGSTEVILATGESADPNWMDYFRRRLGKTPVREFVDPSFLYLAEQSCSGPELTRQLRSAMDRLFADCQPEQTIVWAHNLGIARNLLLARELVIASQRLGLPLVSHHHDWWFDNRWLRWPEMRRFGIRSIKEVARIIFPRHSNVRHVAINHADARTLKVHFGDRAFWVPNLTEPIRPSSPARLKAVRAWMQRRLNVGDAPIWLLPCRLLRRKNVAEALLLTRWLRPEAWLVMTGGVSSADEQSYADRLLAAAKQHRWPLRLEILRVESEDMPAVSELVEASETVLLTSIQEGFGLPFLEAAASRRPLIARSIPNIAPDLEQFGFEFPQYYDELYVEPRLFDWNEEVKRQTLMFREWKQRLPVVCRKWAGIPAILNVNPETPTPIPFSRLTLAAQIEVLSQPVKHSWELCSQLNPFLKVWKQRASEGRLSVSQWPDRADDWLSGSAYARHFNNIIRSSSTSVDNSPDLGSIAHTDFIKLKLHRDHLFPLLWTSSA